MKIYCEKCHQFKDRSHFQKSNIIHWSVDFNFCRKAKESGYKIYCDPGIEIGHIGDAPVKGKKDFLEIVKKKANINNKFKLKPSSES